MRGRCPLCQGPTAYGWTVDKDLIVVDPVPAQDGTVVAKGDLAAEPRMVAVADLLADDPDLTEAPRYRRHRCVQQEPRVPFQPLRIPW